MRQLPAIPVMDKLGIRQESDEAVVKLVKIIWERKDPEKERLARKVSSREI